MFLDTFFRYQNIRSGMCTRQSIYVLLQVVLEKKIKSKLVAFYKTCPQSVFELGTESDHNFCQKCLPIDIIVRSHVKTRLILNK